MQPATVLLLAATVVALAGAGLVVGALREGPLDLSLEPVSILAGVEGNFQTVRGGVLGTCPLPPCEAETTVDFRFQGLPDVPYTARLDGASRRELGPLVREGDSHVIRWTAPEDHSDKDRIVVTLAGRDVAAVPFGSVSPASFSWGARPAEVHLNEIGAFTVSTVALAELEESPPEGWEFRAHLEGSGGTVDLGEMSGSSLDARVERVRLAEQDRFIVTLQPIGAGAGFPILAATL